MVATSASSTTPRQWLQIFFVGSAIAVLLALLLVMLARGPAVWRAVTAAAVSLTSQWFPVEPAVRFIPLNPLVQSGDLTTIEVKGLPTPPTGKIGVAIPCGRHVAAYLPDTYGVYQPIACGSTTTMPAQKVVRLILVRENGSHYLDVPLTLSYIPPEASKPNAVQTTLITLAPTTRYRDQLGIQTSTASSTANPSQVVDPSEKREERVTQRMREAHSPASPSSRESSKSKRPPAPSPTTPTHYSRPLTPPSTPVTHAVDSVPDLTIAFLERGYVNRTTGSFTATTSPLDPSKRVGVRFVIRNEGTGAITHSWRFSAILPTNPPDIFRSPAQPLLRPGERVEYTLAFDQLSTASSTATLRIVVDPDREVRESREDNNTLIVQLPVQGGEHR